MLLTGKPAFHYHPANLTELRDVGPYYRDLAQAICRSIETLERHPVGETSPMPPTYGRTGVTPFEG